MEKTIQFSILFLYVSILLTPFTGFIAPPALASDGDGAMVRAKTVTAEPLQFSDAEKQWIKAHPIVRARVGNAPPLHFFRDRPMGISVDYLNRIAERAGFQVRYVRGIPWTEAMNLITAHEKIDLILTAKITENRKQQVLFTDNYLIIPLVIFTRDDTGFISGIEDLNGKTVAVERGYVLQRQLAAQYPQIQLLLTDTSKAAVNAVATGRAEGYIGNLTITTYILRQNNLNNIKIAAPTPFENHDQAMAIRSDWPQLAGIINKTLRQMPPEEHEAIKDRWMTIHYEYGISRSDVIKWVLVFAGFSLAVIGVVMFWNRRLQREVRQRKQSEKALKENEVFIRSVMDNLPIGIAVNSVDPQVTFTYVNPNFSKLYRTTRQQLADPDVFWEAVYEDPVFREEIKTRVLRDCAGGDPENMYWKDVPITRKGQETTYISARNVPIPDKQLMISTVWDVTHRKRVEQALKENERKYRMLIENLPQKIFYKDKDSVYVTCNQKFADDLHLTPEEIAGKSDLDFFPEELAEKYRMDDQRIIASGQTEKLEEAYVVDGKKSIVETIKTPVNDSDGHVVGLLGIFWDITEQRLLEDQLQQAQKMEAIGTLAGGIAHDFNNILFPLLGFTEMLQEDLPRDSPHQSNIAEILQAALRAKELVKQILAFSRQGDQTLKPLRLQSLLKETLKLLSSSIPKTIDIRSDIDESCGLVVADPTQIHQVIMNLATNAYHAMQTSGGQLNISLAQIEIDARPTSFFGLGPGRYAVLRVIDTGEGIPEAAMDKIFDPYFTTKPKDKGTGLGLSIVKGIVSRCNGDIHVYSEPGKGTEFRVYLPIMNKGSDHAPPAPVEPLQTGDERILLVDDEEAIVKMEALMLRRLGYHVTTETRSTKALERFKADPDSFDLIISDMTMPEMTGVQLAAEIKALRPAIPVIICTGFSDSIDEKSSNAMGIQGYLVKPVIRQELAKKIREVLDT